MPLLCRWLIRLASWIVPARERREWRRRWESELLDWWVLVERGEITLRESARMVRQCWGAFADAFWLRFSRDELDRFVRGPAFFILAGAAALAVIALLSDGFAMTRSLVDLAKGMDKPILRPGGYDWRSDRLVGYLTPIVFGLAISAMAVAAGRLSLHRRGWRYWSFFVLKAVGVMVLLPLAWIEGGSWIRGQMPHEGLRVLVGGLLLGIVFIGAFAWAFVWIVDDQRRRCPICVRRLALPVTIGSWASVFEPVATELMCEEGHGSLCLPEAGSGEPDRWTEMDESWRELFDKKM
jgi:hypothetical protein